MPFDLVPNADDSEQRLLFKIAAATSDVSDPPNPDETSQQLLRRIADATASGGGGGGAAWGAITGTLADQTDLNTALGLRTLNSAAAITGGTFAGVTGAGFRDTSAAFDVTQIFTSSTALDAGRSITWDVKNTSHSLKFTGASTVTFPVGTNTLLGSGVANTITTNGAASTPALTFSGSVVTGANAAPQLLFQPSGASAATFSTNGTVFASNQASGFTGNHFELCLNGSPANRILATYQGILYSYGGVRMSSPDLLTDYVTLDGSNGLLLSSNHRIGWYAAVVGSGVETAIYRRADNHLALGIASATPAAQTWGGQQGAGTNITGGTLNLGTRGTGTGTGGVINFQSHAAGASSSTLGTLATVMQITSATLVTLSSGVALRLGNAATTGLTAGVEAALTNATIVIEDSTGQAYRIPCII